MIGSPSELFIWSASMRARVSVGPPAGYGTMTVTGRDGKVSACVLVAATDAIAHAMTNADAFIDAPIRNRPKTTMTGVSTAKK